MISAVIFDRDGVLTQFDVQAGVAYFEPLLPLSLPELGYRWQEWGQVVGFPTNTFEEHSFWRRFWDSLANELQLSDSIRRRLYATDYKHFLQPFADAWMALQTAREHGLRTGVLSNFCLASLSESLTAVGLGNLVDAACAAPAIGAYKPEAAAYESILEQLAVCPAQCLYFDDELPFVEGARALGIQAYLVDRRRDQHDLAQGVVCDLTALPLILNRVLTRPFPV